MASLTRRKAKRPPPAKAPARPQASPCPEWLPPASPLAMPTQDLGAGRLKALGSSPRLTGRRLALLTLTGLITGGASAVMAVLLSAGGWTVLEALAYGLYVTLFAWVAFAFVSALAGFMVTWRLGEMQGRAPLVGARTALLLPTYNEDPGRILAAVQAMHEDLAGLGAAVLFDVFVLSDTRDETIARHEATGVLRLRARLGPEAGVYYRRRPQNTDRKAGNIAEWVQRFGGAYAFMLVLDADSLMSAEAIVRLASAMERDPRLGLLQTAPTIVNAETPFARLQQFAARAYGPMLAAGQDWWSGSEGNYWGHNAILRTRAFAGCAGLPHLPGRKPFGGHIMSHDFVEAALIRRGGWKVRLAVGLEGSYEEGPPTILDMAIRDRRWCQGNLQHLGVMGSRGLHWVSRLHLLRGVLSYATAPLWLVLLLTGAGVWIEQSSAPLMIEGWPAAWLFALTMALLVAPKAMAAVLIARRAATRRGFGGGRRLWLGMALEVVVSALVAPVLMLMQSVAVFDVLLGRDAGWSAQQRDSGRMSRREAWRTHRAHMGIGLAAAGLAFVLDPAMVWWALPVYVGLVLSAPLSLLLSQPGLGRVLQDLGLLVTPEERSPPAVVARAAELRAAYDAEAPARWQIELLFRKDAAVYGPKDIHGRQFAPTWDSSVAA